VTDRVTSCALYVTVTKRSLKRSKKSRRLKTSKPKKRGATRARQSRRADWTHDEDRIQRTLDDGELVSYQEWDSGGPGAGAGRDAVYRYGRKFCVLHDAGLSGPYASIAESVKEGAIVLINEATTRIWHRDKGITFDR